MQDKDLDQLFRSKLDGLEAEPSAKVWPGIAAELEPAKSKRSLIPFLSVAASVLILVAAGVLFIPQKASINKGGVKTRIVKAVRPSAIVPAVKTTSPQVVSTVDRLVKVAAVQHIASNLGKTAGNRQTFQHADTAVNKVIVDKGAGEPSIAVVSPKSSGTIKAVVPDDNTPLSVKLHDDQPATLGASQGIATTALPVMKKDSVPVNTRRRVHNLGDLVNLVVAKVDKRRDKVIEFTDNDDGGSNITGINLGLIKIKKRE